MSIVSAAVIMLSLLQTQVCSRCHRAYEAKRPVYRSSRLADVLVQSSRSASVLATPSGVSAMANLANRESRGSTQARNKRSSSAGLFGLLKSTNKRVGVPRNSCPYCQAEAAWRYVKNHHLYKGSPEKALRHSRTRGWY